MAERLNSTREFIEPGPVSPLGIINFPEQNGIDPVVTEHVQEDMIDPHSGAVVLDRDGLPIPDVDSNNNPILTTRNRLKSLEEIREEATAQALGFYSLWIETPVDLEPGDREYSALRDEEHVGVIAREQRGEQHLSERDALITQLSSLDPRTRNLADSALSRGLNPEHIPQWVSKTRQLQALRSRSASSPKLKQDMALLEREIHLLENNGRREVAQALPTFSRIFGRDKKKQRQVRTGSQAMLKNEEEIEIATVGTGKSKSEMRDREKTEAEQLRNIVTAKGTEIVLGDQKYIVEDVYSQPAQAFIMRPVIDPKDGSIKGYEPRLDAYGKPILEDIYIQVEVPISPKYPDGKRKVLVPRDDRYQSGATRRLPKGAEYCYSDGSRIPTQAIGEESFTYIDDMVVLRPSYTGAEAVQALVNGGIDTSHRVIRVGDLEDYARTNPKQVYHDPDLLEKDRFILDHSEVQPPDYLAGSIKPEALPLAPTYDLSQIDINGVSKKASGHFRRYQHSPDPNTGRPSKRTQAQRAREDYWANIVVPGRMADSYKKAAEQRRKAILGG